MFSWCEGKVRTKMISCCEGKNWNDLMLRTEMKLMWR